MVPDETADEIRELVRELPALLQGAHADTRKAAETVARIVAWCSARSADLPAAPLREALLGLVEAAVRDSDPDAEVPAPRRPAD